MSRTRKSMISTVHAIFCGLQEHIKEILRDLPDTALPQLQDGLLVAHQKLSEYYYRLNHHTIPGLWVSIVIHLIWIKFADFHYYSVLDPCIMYEGLKEDFENERDLLTHLEASKKKLTRKNILIILNHLIPVPQDPRVCHPPVLPFLVLHKK